jgi:NAD(P)H-dependent flavin oxidoreductase YrpB (nitropropane dioxygenase family)
MLWLVNAELASLVSNAGALGIISPLARMEKNGNSSENLMFQIAKTRELTDRPFGISIPLDLEESGILVDVLLKEEVEVVITKFV